jgi:hypothetical protein
MAKATIVDSEYVVQLDLSKEELDAMFTLFTNLQEKDIHLALVSAGGHPLGVVDTSKRLDKIFKEIAPIFRK